jgi:hypothetical protein
MRDTARTQEQTDVSRSLKSATYLLRFTPEEKEELERKVRVAAARGNSPLTLAEALRMGAHSYLDELLDNLPALDYKDGGDESARA